MASRKAMLISRHFHCKSSSGLGGGEGKMILLLNLHINADLWNCVKHLSPTGINKNSTYVGIQFWHTSSAAFQVVAFAARKTSNFNLLTYFLHVLLLTLRIGTSEISPLMIACEFWHKSLASSQASLSPVVPNSSFHGPRFDLTQYLDKLNNDIIQTSV